MKTFGRAAAAVMLASATAPGALAAHAGHGGDHGWLVGAAQPLMGADHLLDAFLLVALGAVVAAGAARALTATRTPDGSTVRRDR